MARNLAISEVRRAKIDFLDDEALEREVDAAALERAARPPDPMLRRAIEDCRDHLPAKPKLALTERLANAGRDMDTEIASRLGMSTNAFLQNITRARKFLADCLKEKGVDLALEMGP